MERVRVERLDEVVLGSLICEVNALKPGNVSQYALGHDMVPDDFILSARLTTPILCNPALTTGQRILESVKITRAAVGCNTNLGMLLLYAPLIRAAEMGQDSVEQLRTNLDTVISQMVNEEVSYIYQAILLANPGGLGHSDHFDVRSQAPESILLAMEAARYQDNIALQYSNGYQEIFMQGFPLIKDYNRRWNSVEWAAVVCYLWYLSHFCDSHIRRKFGKEIAEEIKIKAEHVYKKFKNYKNPRDGTGLLMAFDKELKLTNINPGTSADLTAATILVFMMLG